MVKLLLLFLISNFAFASGGSYTIVTDSSSSLSDKPACAVVATTNQALTGTPTIDGVATAANTLILLTAQSTGSQNGPWMAAAGAWSRPPWYASGNTSQAFQFITTLIRLGTVYQGTTWRMTTSGTITIDTTATTWVVTPYATNSATVTTTTTSVNNAASPYTMLASDVLLLVDTSGGAVTINLPNPNTNRVFRVKDATGTFGTNNCTLARFGSEMIEGVAASLVLRSNWGQYEFQSNGTNWYKISSATNVASITYVAGNTLVWPAGVTNATIFGRGGSGGGSGGGGGGGGSTTTAAGGGGAGAAGGITLTRSRFVNPVPNTSYTITIGSGGSGGTHGSGAAANAAGASGTDATAGTTGGTSSFGSLVSFIGAGGAGTTGNAGGKAGTIAGGGAGGGGITSSLFPIEAGVLITGGGAGGAANVNGAGTGSAGPSYFASRGSSPTVGAAGGANGGGGGAAGTVSQGGDASYTISQLPNGGAGGAAGAGGSPGSTPTASQNGFGGAGGGGGGGGGVLAVTGTAGGDGGDGSAGNAGYITVRWNE